MYIDPLVLDDKAMERDPFVAHFYGHVGLLAGMSCVDGMGKPVDRTKVLWLRLSGAVVPTGIHRDRQKSSKGGNVMILWNILLY